MRFFKKSAFSIIYIVHCIDTKIKKKEVEMEVLYAVLGAVGGIVLGIILGIIIRKKIAEKQIGSAEEQAKKLLEDAIKAAGEQNDN